MKYIKILSATTFGIDAKLVDVEIVVDEMGFPSFNVSGLNDKGAEAVKERVRSAIKSLGYKYPDKRITINLAPIDLKKKASVFDSAILLGLLICSSQVVPKINLSKVLVVGELSLDGTVRPARGVLSMVLEAKKSGLLTIAIPEAQMLEARLVQGTVVFGINSVRNLIAFVEGKSISESTFLKTDLGNRDKESTYTLEQILGQQKAKRALEIAASGGHNICLVGPPGSGKTMLARSLVSILPDPVYTESLEITKIHSIAGLFEDYSSLVKTRPFRSPHHSISPGGLVGGGVFPTPGEVSLAHRGVLFIDEFTEMPRGHIELLRQPVEDGYVVLNRQSYSVRFPSRFILAVAFNPCPCGYYGTKDKACRCSQYQIANYQKKISGPILDRIDLFVDVERLDLKELVTTTASEASELIKTRVEKVRHIQHARYADKLIMTNSELLPRDLGVYCALSTADRCMFDVLAEKLKLSLRSYNRVLRIARTIADMSGVGSIQMEHLAEALQYRSKFL